MDKEKVKELIKTLIKKYESAATAREWQNAARGVQLSHNLEALKQEIRSFKKMAEEALGEPLE